MHNFDYDDLRRHIANPIGTTTGASRVAVPATYDNQITTIM
jgi:hypothetical protein